MSRLTRTTFTMVVASAVAAGCVSVGPPASGGPTAAAPTLATSSVPSVPGVTVPPVATFAPTTVPTGVPTVPTDAPSVPTDAPTDAPAPATDAPTDEPAPPTDAPTDEPAATPGTLDFSKTSNYGSVELAAGFNPDPFTKTGIRSGGSVDASYLPGCNGHASSAPDFEVKYTSGQVFTLLRFYFVPDTAGADTTLIINQPNSTYVCDDDYNFPDNRNPEVNIDPAASGTYDIWIGNYSSDQSTFATGTLYVTQLQANHPE